MWQYLNTIVTDPRLLYLIPYGSTNPENLEFLIKDVGPWLGDRGPLFIFYDQEPILGEFNFELLDHVCSRFHHGDKFILVTTEKNSETVDLIKEKYNCPVVYYFHHVFASHDWFRGHDYNPLLIPPADRKIKKHYITFNRLTSSARVYRSIFVHELIKNNILGHGYVSYSDVCPQGGSYRDNLIQAVKQKLIPIQLAHETISSLDSVPMPLRIDYQNESSIPNNSFILSAVPETQESFCYVVTETCYWERKCHLTEKIFKPILSKMPFILVGPVHNLAYLRSYGFETFGEFWDESYDRIEDPILRLEAIGKLLKELCVVYSVNELEHLLIKMTPILEHNYNLFNSKKFLDQCWNELTTNLKSVLTPDNSIPAWKSRFFRV